MIIITIGDRKDSVCLCLYSQKLSSRRAVISPRVEYLFWFGFSIHLTTMRRLNEWQSEKPWRSWSLASTNNNRVAHIQGWKVNRLSWPLQIWEKATLRRPRKIKDRLVPEIWTLTDFIRMTTRKFQHDRNCVLAIL